jgi:hypothetical protein
LEFRDLRHSLVAGQRCATCNNPTIFIVFFEIALTITDVKTVAIDQTFVKALLFTLLSLRSVFLSEVRRDPDNNNAQWREVEGSREYFNVPCCLREFSRYVSAGE